jgi:hypothetical protein
MDDRMPREDDPLEWLFDGFADSLRVDVDDRSLSGGPDAPVAPLARRRR